MTFYVGQKVVCVPRADGKTRFVDPRHFLAKMVLVEPVVGEVYTIRGLFKSNVDGLLYLWLAEISNPPLRLKEGLLEPLWPADRFRPVVERKTDISVFKAMLNPAPDLVDAQ